MPERLRMRLLACKCGLLIALLAAALPWLTGCSGGGGGAMSDSIAGLQPPQANAGTTATKGSDEPQVTQSDLGMPFYPGATAASATDAQSGSMKTPGEAMILMQTHDSPDRVVAFYMGRLKTTGEEGKPVPPVRRDSNIDDKPVITLSRLVGHTLRAVEIRKLEDITVIELMRMEAPTVNKFPGTTSGMIAPDADAPKAPASPGSVVESALPGTAPPADAGSDPTTSGSHSRNPGLKFP